MIGCLKGVSCPLHTGLLTCLRGSFHFLCFGVKNINTKLPLYPLRKNGFGKGHVSSMTLSKAAKI